MPRTLLALFEDYAGSMSECKRLVADGLAELGRHMTERCDGLVKHRRRLQPTTTPTQTTPNHHHSPGGLNAMSATQHKAQI